MTSVKVSILGAGAFGTALAVALAPGERRRVTLWGRDPSAMAQIAASRCNARYLPDVRLPPELALSAELDQALAAGIVLLAVPMQQLAGFLDRHAAALAGKTLIACCKGVDRNLGLGPVAVVARACPTARVALLTGPSFAADIARGLPTALTLASADAAFAQQMAHALHHSRLRIYSCTDVAGVEIGGAIKNVLAIAAGISDGMQMGMNARAALLTRGLVEMSRLGLKLGGRAETLGGLSGVGDLILTCTGDLSRNRQVGMLLARHQSLPNILKELGHVAEGVYTAREVQGIAARYQVEMPICAAVYRVLYEQLPADKAVEQLLSRAPGEEFSGG